MAELSRRLQPRQGQLNLVIVGIPPASDIGIRLRLTVPEGRAICGLCQNTPAHFKHHMEF